MVGAQLPQQVPEDEGCLKLCFLFVLPETWLLFSVSLSVAPDTCDLVSQLCFFPVP